ncbi:MAG: hypothetical protein AAF211_10515 [Myxococcota bacterium]
MRSATGLFLATWVACGSLDEEEELRAVLPDSVSEGVTWRAVVTTAPREPPRRFSAGFPDSVEQLRTQPWAWPSATELRRGVCRSARFRSDVPVGSEWIEVLGHCRPAMVDEGYCAWALERFAGVGEAYAMLLPACADDPAVRKAVADRGSPDDWVVFWAQRVGHPGIERTVRAVAPAVESGRLLGGDIVLLEALSNDPSTEAGEALLALRGRAADDGVRQVLGHLLWGRDAPRLRAVHDAACADEASPWCGRTREVDLWSALQDAGLDLEAAEALHPHFAQALRATLVDCARDRFAGRFEAGTPARCLMSLARVHPDDALAVASQTDGVPSWTAAAEAVRDPGAVASRLADAGFGPFVDASSAIGAIDWLVESGEARLWPWDAFSDADGPAWALAELVRFAQLDVDTAVEARAAGESSDTWQPRRVHLAWMDGRRYRALGTAVVAPAELGRLVGFVNALLYARKSETRLLLGFAGWETVVVRGRPDALEALVASGDVVPERPPGAVYP